MRAAETLGLAYRAEAGDTTATPSAVLPPSRTAEAGVSVDQATSLDSVFRAFYVLQTASEQLTLDAWDGRTKLEGTQVPQLLRRPDPDQHLADYLAETVTALAGRGNAYQRIFRWQDGQPIALRNLPPLECHPYRDRHGIRKVAHGTGPDLIVGQDVAHLRLLKFTGRAEGLGPVQAAQAGLRGLLDQHDYAAGWFTSATPAGVLKSDQSLTDAEAAAAKKHWNETQAYNRGPAVLGKGLDYRHLHLKPAEAQWLEAQAFGITKVARLFGMTSRMMLAATQGGSDTYSNHQQDEISFVRYTLMRYLREIEITLDQLLPRTKTVRVNVEGLLRTDTLTRYKAHALAHGRWTDVDEIRAIEGLPPLTEAQREQLAATTPTADPSAAEAGQDQESTA